MLEIFKFKSKNNVVNKLGSGSNGDPKGVIRHYPPANKEWFNSIYAYNKNTVRLLPVADKVIVNLIRSYFNMYGRFLEKRIKAPRIRTWKRRLSSRKIWVSKAELKHTSDKVIITLYIFNRQSTYYLRKLADISSFKRMFILINKTKKFLEIIKKQYSTLSNVLLEKELFKGYKKSYFNILVRKYLKKELLVMYYLQSISFNKLKFTSAYIIPLKSMLESFYGKAVVFNLVALKNYYLNSDILTQILISKTRNRKNRVLKVLKASLINIKTPIINAKLIIREPTKYIGIQNLLVADSINLKKKQDVLSKVISKNYLKHNTNKEGEENILNSIRNKTVSGIRLEASGRLTKRIIAARAIFKMKYVGTLKNIDASYKGLSSVILRGNLKSNIQHTKLKSKTRIGSFGLKGWIGSL